MSKYVVSLTGTVNFNPETEVEEILQNVRTILSTVVGSVPLYRDFGMSWEHVDKPYPASIALLKVDVIEAVEKYEPRAKVESVELDESNASAMDGISRLKLVVSIGDEGDA